MRVVTCNVNSKGTLLRLLKAWGANRAYDVVLVQEHHVASQRELQELANTLAAWSWESSWTPAIATLKGTTGGTAILWAKGVPMHGPVLQGGVIRAAGRSTATCLAWPGHKPINFVSAYLKTGGRMCEDNVKILADLGAYAAESGNPFWLGADWQMNYTQIEETGWWRTINWPFV